MDGQSDGLSDYEMGYFVRHVGPLFPANVYLAGVCCGGLLVGVDVRQSPFPVPFAG